MHIVDLGEAQEADPMLTAYRRWLCTHKNTPFLKRDVLLKKYLGDNADTEEWHALFRMCNGLVMSKGLLCQHHTKRGCQRTFLVPTGQCCMALNGAHHDVDHQGQQRTLALKQERFWWPMMVEDY